MDKTVASFFVEGIPVPQGSKVIRRHGDKAWMTDVNVTPLKAWRKQIEARAAIVMDGAEPVDAPIGIEATFYLSRPETVTREYPSVKPDVDKLTRSLFDALGSCIRDDARICEMHVSKKYASHTNTGVFVNIWRLDHVDTV